MTYPFAERRLKALNFFVSSPNGVLFSFFKVMSEDSSHRIYNMIRRLIRLKPLLIISLSIGILLGISPDASAKTRKKKRNYKVVQLKNESPVYEAPNFDSPVKLFLPKGKRVRYFPKRHKGPGGFGVFYKVKIRKNEYGYVVEDDIDAPKKPLVKSPSHNNEIDGPFGEAPFDIKDDSNHSIYLSRYMGFTYNLVNYSEDIAGQNLTAITNFLGIKLSGPGVLIGAPLDVNIMILFGTPTYYQRFASATTGFLLISDIIFMLPLVERQWALIYYGAGPLLTYSKYDVKVKGLKSIWDSQEIRMGGSFPLGVAFKFSSFLLKAEAKYYVEKKRYFGLQVGLQLTY